MTQTLQFNGNNTAILNTPISVSGNYRIEVYFTPASTGNGIFMGKVGSGSQWFGVFNGGLRFRPENQMVLPIPAADIEYIAVIDVSAAGTLMELRNSSDNSLLDSASRVITPSWLFDLIGDFRNGGNVQYTGQISRIRLFENALVSHDWRADQSDPNTGSDPVSNPLVFLDTVGTNNFVGDSTMSTANWISLGGNANATFTSQGLGVGTFLSSALQSTLLTANGLGSTNILSGAVAATDFTSTAEASVLFDNTALAYTELTAAGISASNFNNTALVNTSYSINGSSVFNVLADNGIGTSATFSAQGTSTVTMLSSAVALTELASNGISSANILNSAIVNRTFNSIGLSNINLMSSALVSASFDMQGIAIANFITSDDIIVNATFNMQGASTFTARSFAVANSSFSANGFAEVNWSTASGKVYSGVTITLTTNIHSIELDTPIQVVEI